MDTPLLSTKLHIPPLRPNLVTRPRLTERLDDALRLGHRLSLICAPAGFGKTTLLSEWVHNSGGSAAWVSLDENDNDPVSFWAHFVAALRAALSEPEEYALGVDLLTVLRSSPPMRGDAFHRMDTLLSSLINEVAELSVSLVVIFDDYHLIETQSIHDGVSYLLRHLPTQMHLIISSRLDPPLPLARLRGRYLLTEIREADLRFTQEETIAFLNVAMGLGLSEDHLMALEVSTEGWIVGLQLAALALQGTLSIEGKGAAAVEAFIQAFGGSHRHIIDYLVEEVLQQQSDEIRTFLFQTAILDRLTAPLCDAVRFGSARSPSDSEGRALRFGSSETQGSAGGIANTRGVDSQAILTGLEQANLFLIPLDERREWYRYHHLFAEFLNAQANLPPQELAALHRKAARWYEANGFGDAAIKHALEAGDMVDAARLIALSADDVLRHARFTTFFRWLDALPDEYIRANPELAATVGWALALSGDPMAAESYARAAAESLTFDSPQSAQAQVASLQAVLALLGGARHKDRTAAIEETSEVLELIGDANPFFRGMLLSVLGESQRAHGDLETASRTLHKAVFLNQQAGNDTMAIVAIGNLAILSYERGRRREAMTLCQETIDRYVDIRGCPTPPAGIAHVILAMMHYEANELALAHRHVLQGLKANEQTALIAMTFMGRALLARIQQAMGQTESARTTIDKLCQAITPENAWRMSAQSAMAVRAELHLKQGDLTAVERWADAANLSPADNPSYFWEPHYLVYVRLLLVRNQPLDALKLATKLERLAQQDGRPGSLVTIHALQALAHQGLGNDDQVLVRLRRALILAAPERYLRSLLDEGPSLAALLSKAQALLGESVGLSFVRSLRAAFQAELSYTPAQPSPLIEPLTERELEVLSLIVAGHSNREIAAELYLAMGTVKKHISNIYGKMGVQRRAQAIARARELDLL
jgi:LuxR family maltose regulon positive regulatory protein